MRSDLAIIIVSHNDAGWLPAYLPSVLEHRGDVTLDVAVVDNGADGAADIVAERFPWARALRSENRGFAHPNNVALRTCDARYKHFAAPHRAAWVAANCVRYGVRALAPEDGEARGRKEAARLPLRVLLELDAPPFGEPPPPALRPLQPPPAAARRR